MVDDLDAARALVADLPDVTAVTRDGDVLGAHFAAGGSTAQPSLIEVQAAVDEATAALAEATRCCERLTFDLSRLEEERAQARQRVDVALAKLHESDATLAAVAEELGQYGSQARSAKGEAERLAKASRPPRRPVTRTSPASPTSRSGCSPRRRHRRTSPTPPSGSGSPRRHAPRARTRWTSGSRCAPPRSGRVRCPAGPTR